MKIRILAISLIYLLILSPVLSTEKKKQGNPWQSLFTEPSETAYIIMDDWVTFTFSNQDENQVFLTIGKLEKQLQTPKRKYKIEDIAIIIHNHLKDCKFSPTDYKQHRRLKKYGFRGLFLLYSHVTNKTYDIEGKMK